MTDAPGIAFVFRVEDGGRVEWPDVCSTVDEARVLHDLERRRQRITADVEALLDSVISELRRRAASYAPADVLPRESAT